MIGKIPKELKIYCRPSKIVNGVTCYPAFPANAEVESMVANAKSWASNYDEQTPKELSIPNGVFDSVTITTLEVRGEGGRAYKVLLEINKELFYVDLREDTLMDTIKDYGIEAGGKLKGTYTFVQYGSQMKLVLIGSEAHNEAIKAENTRKAKSISIKDLKVGHVYKNMSGDEALFLGHVYHINYSLDQNNYTLIEGKKQKKLLFYNLYSWNKQLQQLPTKDDDKKWIYVKQYIELKTSHSFKEDLGKKYDINTEEFLAKLKSVNTKEFLDFYNYPTDNQRNYSYNMVKCFNVTNIDVDKNIQINADFVTKIEEKLKAEEKRDKSWRSRWF